MSIPGSNLLKSALSIIASQTVGYKKFNKRVLNSVGQDIAIYDPLVNIKGSFQPVPRNLYTVYGLDMQKDYWVLYTSNDLLDVERDVSGDQITFNGARYQCESNTNWFKMDGWKSVLCVRVKE